MSSFVNPHLASLFFVDSPTSPGDVRVLSERDLEVTLTWNPSFLPFNITPQYNVYVDGLLEATVDQPMFKLSRAERTCNPYEILVEAFNEVGRNRAELVNVTLPSGGALWECIAMLVSVYAPRFVVVLCLVCSNMFS